MTGTADLFLFLAVIIAASKIGGSLAARIGQPAVFGELAMGVVLGPTVLGLQSWPVFATPVIRVTVAALAQLGMIFLMFVAGLETDLAAMRRVGLVAVAGATGGVILPVLAGYWVSIAFGYGFYESWFIGVVLAATSVSITAQTLIELGQLRSQEGTAILGAAVVDDVLGLLALAVVVAMAPSGGGRTPGLPVVLVHVALFFVAVVLVGWVGVERITHLALRLPVREGLFAFGAVVALFFAWLAEAWGGMAAITGSYVAGVLFSLTTHRHQLEERFHAVSYGFLVPVFFISVGLDADARAIGGGWVFGITIAVVAILTKLLGAGLGAKIGGFNWSQAWRFGVGMISRGEVALIVANIGLGAGVIGESVFTIMVLMTLVTTLLTPVLLRFVFPGAGIPSASGRAPV